VSKEVHIHAGTVYAHIVGSLIGRDQLSWRGYYTPVKAAVRQRGYPGRGRARLRGAGQVGEVLETASGF
jgi:hypothetical protein